MGVHTHYTVTLMTHDTLVDTDTDRHTWTHAHSHTHGHTQTHRHNPGHTFVDTYSLLRKLVDMYTQTCSRTHPGGHTPWWTWPRLSLAVPASPHLPLDLQLDRHPSPEEQVMDWLGIFLGPVAPTALSVPPQAQLVRRMWSARSQTHRGCLGGLRPTHPSVPAVRGRRGMVNQDDLQSPWDTQGQSWECVLTGGAWKTFPKWCRCGQGLVKQQLCFAVYILLPHAFLWASCSALCSVTLQSRVEPAWAEPGASSKASSGGSAMGGMTLRVRDTGTRSAGGWPGAALSIFWLFSGPNAETPCAESLSYFQSLWLLL